MEIERGEGGRRHQEEEDGEGDTLGWSEFSSALLCCGLRIVLCARFSCSPFFYYSNTNPISFALFLWACEGFHSTTADVAFIVVFPED